MSISQKNGVQFYRTSRSFDRNNNSGGNGLNINQNLVSNYDIDNNIRNLGNINNGNVQEIVAFIQALNDPDFDRTIPATVPSDLNPDGNID